MLDQEAGSLLGGAGEVDGRPHTPDGDILTLSRRSNGITETWLSHDEAL